MIDWSKLILNLRAFGLSDSKISAHTGIGRAAISHYIAGSVNEPTFTKGYKLLELHHRCCPDLHELEVYGKA